MELYIKIWDIALLCAAVQKLLNLWTINQPILWFFKQNSIKKAAPYKNRTARFSFLY